MNNKLQFRKALDLILKSNKILLTTHEGTDGDDLGSALAMYDFLKQINKDVEIVISGGVPARYFFLPGHEVVTEQFKSTDFDLVLTFGCNKIQRSGLKELETINIPLINFDHHPDNTNFGQVNVVDPATSSVAELVYYFLVFAEAEITREIATCLLTGIFFDTGGFKHENTTAESLQVSAELLKKGARIDKIALHLFGKKSPSAIKAWAKGLENARFDPEKKMVFSVITDEDLKGIKDEDDLFEGFVEMLNTMPQSKFALFLHQSGDTVRGSLRSESQKKVDVSKIAKSFGGGGHKLASGFSIKGKLVKKGDEWEIQ
jgi:phosphoesterase RecJ-like protein